jgi:fluoroacetyl-CoA thioesterase
VDETPGSRAAAVLTFTVGEQDTAAALGSGSLPVLGTPRLLAWAEAATCAALEAALPAGRTSVGSRVQLEHRAASGVGEEVTVTAQLQHADGRLVRFEVVAEDREGRVVGRAEITRVVVDVDRFLARVARPA